MSESLKDRVRNAQKQAMLSRDRPRLGAIRLMQAEIKRAEIDERAELDDARMLVLLGRMVKQRRDSSRQYQEAGRDGLAEQELFEISVINEFLPAQLDREEVAALIAQTIQETGATGIKDLGRVMGRLKAGLQGRADLGEVSRLAKEKLSG